MHARDIVPVSLNELAEVEGLIPVTGILRSEDSSLVYGSHQVEAIVISNLVISIESAITTVCILNTSERNWVSGGRIFVRQTNVAVDISIQRSIVRSDDGIFLSTFTLQISLSSEDGNHWLLLSSSSSTSRHVRADLLAINQALETLEHALDLVRILDVELNAHHTVLNLIDALAVLILLGSDLSLRSTSQHVVLISVDNLYVSDIVNDNIRGVQVIVSPEVHHAGVLNAVIAATFLISSAVVEA